MTEGSWQLFDDQGRALERGSATKHQVVLRGLLHGAAHVWIWRRHGNEAEILLQKRARRKILWPNRWDISAAGHIMFGDTPLDTALRETEEELGVTLYAEELYFLGVTRWDLPVEDTGLIERELQWIYLAELHDGDGDVPFTLQPDEVAAVAWKTVAQLQADLAKPAVSDTYVPHSPTYFAALCETLAGLLRQS